MSLVWCWWEINLTVSWKISLRPFVCANRATSFLGGCHRMFMCLRSLSWGMNFQSTSFNCWLERRAWQLVHGETCSPLCRAVQLRHSGEWEYICSLWWLQCHVLLRFCVSITCFLFFDPLSWLKSLPNNHLEMTVTDSAPPSCAPECSKYAEIHGSSAAVKPGQGTFSRGKSSRWFFSLIEKKLPQFLTLSIPAVFLGYVLLQDFRWSVNWVVL